MLHAGHVVLILKPDHSLSHVPAHLDCLLGASREATWLDGAVLDRTIRHCGCYFRASGVYHSRARFGRPGEQHARYDDLEESLALSRTYRLELDDPAHTGDVVAALRDLEIVEAVAHETLAVTPGAVASMQKPRFSRQPSPEALSEPHHRVRAPQALEIEPGDERTTVAVVDTGVSLGHPEFQRRLLAGYDTVDLGIGSPGSQVRLVGDSRGRDFSPLDMVGHGSHIAGILGAHGWRIPPGLAGRSLVLPIRVLAAARSGASAKRVGVGALSDIDAGLKVAVDLGAVVINMSFGTPESSVDPDGPRPHQKVLQYARRRGCVLVAAAGNSGVEERYYPAALPEVLAVGSVDPDGRRSSFSTYGAHVALSAPGEQIVSAGLRGYRYSTGTSHAAPFVSGAAALLVSRGRRRGCSLAHQQVAHLLTSTARRRPGEQVNPETGHGLLDAAAALRALDAAVDCGGEKLQ